MSILLSQARAQHCRRIVCEAVPPRQGQPRDIFGGRRICGAPVAGNGSYCLGHRLVVYAPVATAPAPAQDFTVVRRPADPDTLLELTEIFG